MDPVLTESKPHISEVRVPREIVNADSVFVVNWLVAEGDTAADGQDVCTIETSKAAVTVPAPAAGFVRHRAQPGDEVAVGGILGFVTAAADTALPAADTAAPAVDTATISPKAMLKIKELGLDPALFAGRGLIREKDVLDLAKAQPAAAGAPRARSRTKALSPVQRRVAATMERSLAVPVAYVEREVDFNALRARAQATAKEIKSLVTPVDLFAVAVAAAAAEHPSFNATLSSDRQVTLWEEVHLGVAVDLDDDLYVLVLKNADTKSVGEVSTELRRLQMLAMRHQLTPEQTTGSTLTITSLLGRGVHRFQPILPPGESAIVALADPTPAGSVWITLGFDHRVANGSQAAQFLASVARHLAGGA